MRCRFFYLLLLTGFSAIAQNREYTSHNSAAVSYYQKANGFLDRQDRANAIVQLKNALSVDSNFIEANIQLADMYRSLQQPKAAVPHYRKALDLNPNFDRGVYLKLGESEVNIGQYKQALIHLEKFITYPDLTAQNRFYARKLIADCNFSINALEHPVPFKPVNLGPEINSANDEYLPVSTADERTLIFTRKIANNEDFYRSIKQADNKWSRAAYLSKQINTAEYNEGAQAISQDGKYLFFTGCNRPDGQGRCDIYVSQRKGDDWSKPFNLSAPINSPGWESQPSISADGRTIYFVSNRKGGYGGYDIWKCRLGNKGWSDPENLGPNVNTPYDEQSPFIHPDDSTLYFCSNGWPGLGNKDLFVSRLSHAGKWQKPDNLGYPINSYGDENGMSISTSGSYAYFASNSLGGYGGFDIYMFELPPGARPHAVTYVQGMIVDAVTKRPLEANVEIVDLATNMPVYQNATTHNQGDFLATLVTGRNYGLTISKNGYLFASENFSLIGQEAHKPFNIEVPLNTIEVGRSAVLKNIFFDINRYDLKPESRSALRYLIDFMAINPTVSIEISGHTDNVGNDKINQTLSENRAKAVYDYLVNNGVNAAKLKYKGYGKLQPVAANNNDENRARNRRTEFKIIAK
ncbi:OmpA family protein [Mucilaginibacter daejeonensis]|uniref:OmpA family protein n=1 Tax=Mucilaginibacter daejeonensis TaxID=398049 RepID=UPI001D177307|nr:OmpA family protein [Mucilaginibacter daejeonensis]UEG51599.1 OmpA family protein [Mucilaginibacter daejeonensis]